MILSAAEIRSIEARAVADGVSAEALMDDAGAQIASAVRQFFPQPGECIAVFGKGNNGGDALVAARHLAIAGWTTHLVPAFPTSEWEPLVHKKFDEAGLCLPAPVGALPTLRGQPLVILDGLLGTGAKGPLREPIAALTRRMNASRHEANVQVFALDLPTGLDADSGAVDSAAVVADFTLTIGFAKPGLLADAATHFVGRLAVLPLAALTARVAENADAPGVATAESLAPLLRRRAFDSHKGDYGRIGILAGSPGFAGAAVMAAQACVHAGAGLVSLYVMEEIHATVAAAVPPEVMVRPVRSFLEILGTRRDVLALGPGLGQERREEVLTLIHQCEQPMVIDADGLNILATDLSVLRASPAPRLLTPHPGEMARLHGSDAVAGEKKARCEIVKEFTARWPVTLLLKGARTLIGEQGHALSFNSTGTPGMASGGMGDALTGVCAALLGHELAGYDASRLAAWLCGRAGELASSHGGESVESLSATKLIAHLGGAFHELRARCF